MKGMRVDVTSEAVWVKIYNTCFSVLGENLYASRHPARARERKHKREGEFARWKLAVKTCKNYPLPILEVSFWTAISEHHGSLWPKRGRRVPLCLSSRVARAWLAKYYGTQDVRNWSPDNYSLFILCGAFLAKSLLLFLMGTRFPYLVFVERCSCVLGVRIFAQLTNPCTRFVRILW